MLRKFIKDGTIYMVGDVILKGVSFLLVPVYTSVLSSYDFGIIDLLAAASALINVTLALEITQAIARFYSECETEEEKKIFVSTAYYFTIGMEMLFLTGSVLFQSYTELFIWGQHMDRDLYILAMVSIVTSCAYYFMSNQMRWCLFVKEGVVGTTVAALTRIVFTVIFVVLCKVGIIGVFAGQIIGDLVGIFWSHRYLHRYLYGKFSLDALKSMLYFSVPLVLSSTMIVLANYVDRWGIRWLMSISDVGLYSMAAKLSSVVALLVGGFCKAMTPLVYSEYKNEETRYNIEKLFGWYLACGLIASGLFFAVVDTVVEVFFPVDYCDIGICASIIFLTVIASNAYVFFPGIFLMKKTRLVVIISACVLLSNIFMNNFLIPLLGINGAALSTFIAAIVGCTLYFMWGQQEYEIPVRIIPYLKGVICFVISVLTIGNIQEMIGNVMLRTLIGSIIAIIAGVIILRLVIGVDYMCALNFVQSKIKSKNNN